jgi:DNA-binding LacI/PurR family transcriptional regulator
MKHIDKNCHRAYTEYSHRWHSEKILKKVTIYDIVSACKVSPRTVTRAFKAEASVKPEIRQRILSEAAARDYHPNGIASRLAKPALHFIGVIVNVLPLFTRGIMRGFMEAQRELSDY